MAQDDRYGERGWRGEQDDQDSGRDDRTSYGRRGEYDYDRGYGRDPSDRDPGAHVDYYRGGDRGQQRMGPEGGFEMRSDYRRSDRHADQGKSWSANKDQQHQDPQYSDWRRRQVESLDRDYEEYCRENSARFEQEFGSWRERRGQQRQSLARVAEHMEVVGADGQHIGKVDKTDQDRIVLAKSDPSAGGRHHSIPCSWIESVDDKVTLSKSSEEAMQAWRDEETNRALFEGQDRGSNGPHILERSFSGTYRDE